jgi:hypothetical protein
MFWKRKVPIAIVAFVGTLTLFGWFVNQEGIASFVNDDATQWYDILASFAIFLGALNLIKLQAQKIQKRKRGWPYSIFAIGGFIFAFVAGFIMRGAYHVEIKTAGTNMPAVAAIVAEEANMDTESAEVVLSLATEEAPLELDRIYFTKRSADRIATSLQQAGAEAKMVPEQWGSHLMTRGSLFNWMFRYWFTPLSATMFALLAFFVASASYRAFRIRNFEATLLLVAGIIIMLGRVPIGSYISSWFVMYVLVLLLGVGVNTWAKDRRITFISVAGGLLLVTIAGFIMGWPVDRPAIFFLPKLQDWIYYYPNVAGARAIMIGIGLGIIATSIRYILGIEKSYIGE